MSVTEESLPHPDLATVVAGPTARQSVQEALRAQYDRATAKRSETVNLLIPGFDSLWGTFRAITDYGELYESTDPASKRGMGERQLNQAMALDLIMAACVTTYAVVNGERMELNAPLGIAVYNELFPAGDAESLERPQSDREAALLLFPLGSVSLVTFATQLQLWQEGKLQAIDGELLGNS